MQTSLEHNAAMIHVSAADRLRRAAALDLLFQSLPEAERELHVAELIAAAACETLSLDGLLIATSADELVGAALYVLRSDRTAFAWPPVAREASHRDAVCDALLAEVGRRVDRAEARLAQCVLERDQTVERRIVERNGFAHVADLVFLERPLSDPIPDDPDALTHATVFDAPTNAEQFARVLERTYVGTLDCPMFSGRLSGKDALEGHALAGEFDPAKWQVFHAESGEVGALLLNNHPDRSGWEVVYMGIVPEARGRGYGRAMLLRGLRAARVAGCARMFLACDCANCYALKMYRELGFVETATRSVFVRFPSARTIAE